MTWEQILLTVSMSLTGYLFVMWRTYRSMYDQLRKSFDEVVKNADSMHDNFLQLYNQLEDSYKREDELIAKLKQLTK